MTFNLSEYAKSQNDFDDKFSHRYSRSKAEVDNQKKME